MSKCRLFIFFAAFFASCHAVLASHSSPLVFYPRDGNATSTSASLDSTNFSFAIPSNSHDPNFTNWVAVVCLRPELITVDQCNITGFTRCPNGDVSGILVRVPAYLANLLLGIIVMYDHEQASDAVWTQLLTVYSLLISGGIAILTQGLSRFHSSMTVFLVMSPLSTTLVVYAILGFCGRPHRLDKILSSSTKHLLPRLLVVVFWLLSLALLIFTSHAGDNYFTAASPCDTLVVKGAAIILNLIFIPYLGVAVVIAVFLASFHDGVSTRAIIGTCVPFMLLIVGLGFALIRSRRELAQKLRERNGRSRFWVFWKFSEDRYPFLHFCGVFLIPMIYWVIANEIRLTDTPDNLFSPSFGQVLAVFVVLPPLWQVLSMIPHAFRWFSNLAIIRVITGRPRPPVRDSVSLAAIHLPVMGQEMGSLSSRDKLEP
ncbi:hypothetical protein B0H13DRAFT_2200841 [Mycena leptocephala]|nr:hypothetical protein B0H13DRAFT_2200841 [Mycena leptocephala]